ncbi:hypothetical protein K1T71_009945 [Dendrolimus kikuchii]|uniref:Uncharacterized protein n=1 Tax=Dendrolimus kikuchii TaxID=765133 RepID=A0ACC1CUB5_9NEOP|nr:hypothetical protein K1T71_009945 [Dendrolimus kikuchii]
MNKSGADPKVKKTLNRNYEQKIRSYQKHVVRDVACSSKLPLTNPSSSKETDLAEPSLCSSEALAHYLTDIKNSAIHIPKEDTNIDKGQLCAKMTKKLNFHFNDKIYKNLIELNASVEELKSKKEKRPVSIKKDLEPNIEDFYQDTKEFDSIPTIPIMRPKYKPVKNVENGDLHKLITKFECL